MARSALDLLCSRLPELLLVAVTGNAIFLVVFFFVCIIFLPLSMDMLDSQ